MNTLVKSLELTETVCGKCGGIYAITESFRADCERNSPRGWHCPYCGCAWGYWGKSEANKLREQLARERATHDQTKAELKTVEHRRSAQLAATTKLRARSAAGCCGFCNRTFADLRKHVESKHPEKAKLR